MSNVKCSNNKAPLVVFTFTRVEHTIKVITALSKCLGAKESRLYIHLDAPRNESEKEKSQQLKKFYSTLDSSFENVEVIEQDVNLGCDRSMLYMMEIIFKKYDRAIVLEDDDLPHAEFINYMNFMLEKYESDKSIAGISAYCPPININEHYPHSVYKSFRGASWGWSTWRDDWVTIDWEAKNYQSLKSSFSLRKQFSKGGQDMFPMLLTAMEMKAVPNWDIIRCFDLFNKNKYFIYPTKSLIKNIGFDGTGLNCGVSTKYDVSLEGVQFDYNSVPEKISFCKDILNKFYKFYSYDKNDRMLIKIFKKMRVFGTLFLLKSFFRSKKRKGRT